MRQVLLYGTLTLGLLAGLFAHAADMPNLPRSIPAWESVYAEVYEADAAADALWRTFATREDCDVHRAKMRDAMRKAVGPFPERTPLNARVTGRVAWDGCIVEKVLFESRPKFYVTALLYLPDVARFAAPYPAALLVCGHSDAGKNAPWYRRACLKVARSGVAVIAIDPVAQGERIQRPEDANVRRTWIHSHLATAAGLVGRSFAACEIWDGMRALDYLETRPEIRKEGFGCLGNSGGGTQSIYLSALDPRVIATASSCFLSTLRAQTYARGLADGEQILFGQLASGITHAGYELMGVGSVLHCGRRGDMIPFLGTLETAGLVRDVASRTGEPGRYAFFSAAGPHGYCESTVEASVRWLRRHLRGAAVSLDQRELERLDEGFDLTKADAGADWLVTETGRVCDIPDATNGYAYIERELDLALTRRAPLPDRAAVVRSLADIREERCLGLKTLSETSETGLVRRRLSLALTDGFALSAFEHVPTVVKGAPVLLLSDADQACFSNDVDRLVADGRVVLTANLMGVGREGMSKHNLLNNANLDEELAKMLYLLGQSLVGRRAEQIIALARHLVARGEGVPRVVADGRIAVAAAHAKTVAPEAVGELKLRNPPCSWAEAIRTRMFVNYAELVNGALLHYDWTDLKGD